MSFVKSVLKTIAFGLAAGNENEEAGILNYIASWF